MMMMMKLVPCMIDGVKKFFFNPLTFVRQPAFLFIWGVYGGTYIVANSIEALCERSATSPLFPKFFGSSAANITLSVLKDKAYARMFGVGDPKPLPKLSYGIFATRDSMTILASFTLPGYVGAGLRQMFGLDKHTADNVAQLITPCSMQLLSTPLHLHGLDLYNRQDSSIPKADRLSFIRQEYFKTAMARMARIFPAFGVGGVVNKYVRIHGKEWILEHYK